MFNDSCSVYWVVIKWKVIPNNIYVHSIVWVSRKGGIHTHSLCGHLNARTNELNTPACHGCYGLT